MVTEKIVKDVITSGDFTNRRDVECKRNIMMYMYND